MKTEKRVILETIKNRQSPKERKSSHSLADYDEHRQTNHSKIQEESRLSDKNQPALQKQNTIKALNFD
jgi:hypothetical protein